MTGDKPIGRALGDERKAMPEDGKISLLRVERFVFPVHSRAEPLAEPLAGPSAAAHCTERTPEALSQNPGMYCRECFKSGTEAGFLLPGRCLVEGSCRDTIPGARGAAVGYYG